MLYVCVNACLLLALVCPVGGRDLIIISLDGFRYDFVDMFETELPTFRLIRQMGVHAERMRNTFVTKTFPNHFSLSTGLYEESHGIVGNEMYDPVYKEKWQVGTYNRSYDTKWFDVGGEPLWVTASKQGLYSCVVMWPGNLASYKGGHLPNVSVKYDQSWPLRRRIDFVLNSFRDVSAEAKSRNESALPKLAMIYFHQPDRILHKYGINNESLLSQLVEIDDELNYLNSEIQTTPELSDTNVVIVSDHGMMNIKKDDYFLLSSILPAGTYRTFGHSPVQNILPNPGHEERLLKILRSHADKNNSRFIVYAKQDIPTRFHYKNNRRVMKIFAIAKPGYDLWDTKPTQYKSGLHGNHGYNNTVPEMHGIFLAWGSAFRRSLVLDLVEAVDIYGLACEVLKIEASPNNGSLIRIGPALDLINTEVRSPSSVLFVAIGFGIVVFVLLIIFLVSTFCCQSNDNAGTINLLSEGYWAGRMGDQADDDFIAESQFDDVERSARSSNKRSFSSFSLGRRNGSIKFVGGRRKNRILTESKRKYRSTEVLARVSPPSPKKRRDYIKDGLLMKSRSNGQGNEVDDDEEDCSIDEEDFDRVVLIHPMPDNDYLDSMADLSDDGQPWTRRFCNDDSDSRGEPSSSALPTDNSVFPTVGETCLSSPVDGAADKKLSSKRIRFQDMGSKTNLFGQQSPCLPSTSKV